MGLLGPVALLRRPPSLVRAKTFLPPSGALQALPPTVPPLVSLRSCRIHLQLRAALAAFLPLPHLQLLSNMVMAKLMHQGTLLGR